MKRLILVCLCVMAAAFLTRPLPSQAQEPVPPPNAVPVNPGLSTVSQPAEKPEAQAVRVVGSESTEPVISMSFDETPLSDVIKAFRDATGANIISSGTNLQNRISISLDNVPWRKGLSSILDPQGLQLLEQPTGSGIFVVTTKTLEIPRITRTFNLEFAKASDVTNLLGKTFGPSCNAAAYAPANVVVLTATEQQIEECEKILTAIDKPRLQVYIEARFVEMTASAFKKLGLKWNSLGTESGWGVTLNESTLGYSDTSTSSKNRTRNTAASASVNDTATSSTTSDSTLSDSLADTFVNDLRDISGSGNSGNSSGSSLSRTINSVANESAGRTYDTSKSHDKNRFFSGSLSMDAFSLTMNAFEQLDGVSVFSNPKIIVANEETALVDMTTKEPNVSVKSTRSGTAGDQLDVTAELAVIPGVKEPFVKEAFFSYGISLKVIPRVSPSGQITVEIEPSISDKIGSYTIAGVSADTPIASYPIIDMRRIQTVFSMQSGTTAVIGGLSKTTEGNIDSGIPLLRELPWIGSRLFGWKSRSKEQTEIIIFVTVGIANPVDLPEDIGMPKNAVLSRDLLTGDLKEPGDRTKAELLSLDDPKPLKSTTAVKPSKGRSPEVIRQESPVPAPLSEREAAQAAQPAVVEPLLQN